MALPSDIHLESIPLSTLISGEIHVPDAERIIDAHV